MPLRAPRACAALICLASITSPALAQPRPASLQVTDALAFSFPDSLVSAPTQSRIAWTVNDKGVRNIYVADAPGFRPRRLTSYADDDGLEITSLAFSPDGNALVYVRGGDHGATRQVEAGRPPSLSGTGRAERIQIWTVSAVPGANSAPILIGPGDHPAIAPGTGRVAFVRERAIWLASLDGKSAPEPAVSLQGTAESPRWSPDGSRLAFVSNRGSHSFVAVYDPATRRLRYVAASTARDALPAWSPDGKHLAFVRQPATSASGRPPLAEPETPWAILVASMTGADDSDVDARPVWNSDDSRPDPIPRVRGGANLRWAGQRRLIFMSQRDGWAHVYALEERRGTWTPTLLTPGDMMVEHFDLAPGGDAIVFSANGSASSEDRDRRYLFATSVSEPRPRVLTKPPSLAWAPVFTADGQFVAHVSAGPRTPPAIVVRPVSDLDRGQELNVGAGSYLSTSLRVPEAVSFRAADGTTVYGQVLTDGGAERKPAVIYLHGGPARQMLLGWHPSHYYSVVYAVNQLMAQRGFVTLSLNYRRSVGYGSAFENAPGTGLRGASEYADIVAAAEYLRSRRDVDARRIGVWGGSYGGYLASLALARNSDLFAAGVTLHAVHDRIPAVTPLQWAHAAAGDGPTETEYRNAIRIAYESSPIASIGAWRSPVLLIQGDDDRNVAFSETIEMKARLRAAGVDVEEKVIPDETHTFLTWRAWVSAAEATLDFFRRRLGGHAGSVANAGRTHLER